MEPWLWEMGRQRQLDRRLKQMPRCVCCGEHISTERCLKLVEFGLQGYACEDCVELEMRHTEDIGG